MNKPQLCKTKLQITTIGLIGILAISAQPSFAVEILPATNSTQPATKKLQQAQAFNDRGVDLAEQGKVTQAIAAFSQAIQIYPTFENAHNNLGLALGSQNKFSEAAAAFKKALAINPQNFETYNNLGIALGSQGNFKEAVSAFNTAIQINPQEPTSHQNLGVAFWSQGRVTDAIASLQKAKQLYAAQNKTEGAQQVEKILQQVRSRSQPRQ